MATIVLGAVGALFGPIGAAVGTLAGRALDQAVLFKPKGREGRRLAELQVQTSSYGSQIPRLFGTMRVAGSVIWATDLRETREKSGGGKGRPSVTTFSYSASFAVALSARRIGAIRRIWADGNLLRGAAGDFKTELGAMRVHMGGEDQPVDPLIASAQGPALAPAHRGIAYVLFEDLALGDYGNRIPSLTFEVEADAGPVAIGAMAATLSDGRLTGAGLAEIDGFAAGGSNVREALASLVEGFDLALRETAEGLTLLPVASEAGAVVARDSLCRAVNGRAHEPVEHRGIAADAVPVQLSVRHHDAERDYQAGVQKVARPGPGRVEEGLDMPAVMTSGDARSLAAARLGSMWAGRAGLTLHCGWDVLEHRPGAVVTVEGAPGLWRIEAREWEAMALRLTLRRVAGASASAGDVTSGAIVRQVDAPHGATTLMLADLPPMTERAAAGPAIVVAASGGPGWRRAALFAMSATGEAEPIGRTAPRAIMGALTAPLAAASSLLIDRNGACLVQMLAEDMALTSADEAGLAMGRNLCLVGRELLQFASAEQTGPGQFRLTGLRRGLRGTEWAIGSQEAGAPFLMIEEARMMTVPPEALAGGTLTIAAVGIGDVAPAEATIAITGEAIKPPGPVHLRAVDDGAGGWSIGWTRRSRTGWRWIDGADAPLAEESELYAVEVTDGSGAFRSAQVGVPAFHYDAAMRSADLAAGHGGPFSIRIRQMGAHAAGQWTGMALVP